MLAAGRTYSRQSASLNLSLDCRLDSKMINYIGRKNSTGPDTIAKSQ
jgi:hypothetical protein